MPGRFTFYDPESTFYQQVQQCFVRPYGQKAAYNKLPFTICHFLSNHYGNTLNIVLRKRTSSSKAISPVSAKRKKASEYWV